MGYTDLVIFLMVGVFIACASSQRTDNQTPEEVSEAESLHEEGMRIVQRIYSILETITNMGRNREVEEERSEAISRYNAKRRPGGDFKSQAWRRKKRSTFGKNLMDITFLQQLDSETKELKADVVDFLESLRKMRDIFFQWLRTSSNKSNIKFDNNEGFGFVIQQVSNDDIFAE